MLNSPPVCHWILLTFLVPLLWPTGLRPATRLPATVALKYNLSRSIVVCPAVSFLLTISLLVLVWWFLWFSEEGHENSEGNHTDYVHFLWLMGSCSQDQFSQSMECHPQGSLMSLFSALKYSWSRLSSFWLDLLTDFVVSAIINFFLFCTRISSFLLQLDWNCSLDLFWWIPEGLLGTESCCLHRGKHCFSFSYRIPLHLSLVLLQQRLQSSKRDVRCEGRVSAHLRL